MADERAEAVLHEGRERTLVLDRTMTFSLSEDKEAEMRQILMVVYDALREKGHNPISQIVGYILS